MLSTEKLEKKKKKVETIIDHRFISLVGCKVGPDINNGLLFFGRLTWVVNWNGSKFQKLPRDIFGSRQRQVVTIWASKSYPLAMYGKLEMDQVITAFGFSLCSVDSFGECCCKARRAAATCLLFGHPKMSISQHEKDKCPLMCP